MPLHYKLLSCYYLYMFEGCIDFHGLVAVLCMVSMIVNVAYFSLYFTTQWHSMMDLRNALPV